MTVLDRIAAFVKTHYGVTGSLLRLAGENENYLITCDDDRRYVLKLADEDTRSGFIEIEHLAVERLKESGLGIALPGVVPTTSGRIEAGPMPDAGGPMPNTGGPLPNTGGFLPGTGGLRGRLLEFVDGTAWCEAPPAGGEQRRHLGRIIARMGKAMEAVRHPDAGRTHAWDLSRADQHCPAIAGIPDPGRRRILEEIFHWFRAIAKPRFSLLPTSLIHGDINDDNVLVADGRVRGILDFGDCLRNPAVCDLAIALAYHTLDEDDPLGAAADIVGAYHGIRPLSPDELMVLYPLMCARLGVSVIISNRRRHLDPDRAGWFVSEKRAWKNLEIFSAIPPADAARTLASGTGVPLYTDQGASPETLAKERSRHIAPSLSVSYQSPLKIVEGKGQYLYDYHGRPFLDLYNNVCHVGHCHPGVVAAGQAQMARLNTNTRYLYDVLTRYAARLTDTLPEELSACFFVNSGSEANELALRIAQTVTGHRDMLVVDGAYHGHTNRMIQLSPYKFMGKGGKGRPEPWVHVVPVADGYRGEFKGQGPDTGKAYADRVGEIIRELDRPLAGFITESLLSCGGQVIPPRDYFKHAFAHVRAAGGLCIADEVQTGFGRTGEAFWAFRLQEVVPDIVVMGKPMGNGHPMAAVVTRPEIAREFANGMEFFATFGGNPVSCAIGLAVLDVIRDEQLQAHAKDLGRYLLAGLARLRESHGLIGDVRGTGLFLGLELVTDRTHLTPAAGQARDLVNRLRNRGILLGTDGPFANVIKIKPPMVITRADADMFLRILDDELTDLR